MLASLSITARLRPPQIPSELLSDPPFSSSSSSSQIDTKCVCFPGLPSPSTTDRVVLHINVSSHGFRNSGPWRSRDLPTALS